MQESSLPKPIGLVLQEADLISASQLEVALQDQSQFGHLLLGEILALRGWIKQETADFFAQHWTELLQDQDRQKQPLGYYLKLAALLDDHQINTILDEQLQIGVRFGELAVLKGWLKQKTIDFFLEHLISQNKSDQKQVLFIGEPQIIFPC
ncbi:MAG: hypothetical protein ACRDEA_01785 [Microcystaceae cyanobacterium]